jgi:spermidine synthase
MRPQDAGMGPAAPWSAAGRLGWSLQAAFLLVGFTAVIAQIVLLRELMVVFYGNELSLGLMLAGWLFWTAMGSALAGRLGTRADPRRLMGGLQVLIAAAFPATILGVRASRGVFHPVPGEILGPEVMLLTSFLVLSLFCLVSGGLFTLGSRLYAREAGAPTATATGTMYLLEAAGSGLGGVLASLLLIRFLDAFQVAAIVALLNLLCALTLAVRGRWPRRAVAGALLAIFVAWVFPFAAPKLQAISLARLWRGFQLLATRTSIYGNLAVTGDQGSRSLFENGLVVFSAPDPESAEEAVHFALLEHPAPRTLLLIGGGVNGSLAQALQHPSLERVDYVELDPAVLDLAQEYFHAGWKPIRADPRVHLHHLDGRLFLQAAERHFDVIAVNLPDPQTAQLNRFYTVEFFREAAARLEPGGVFSFQLKASEEYLNPERAAFLRCIRKTLATAFPETVVLPGETAHFLAANRAGVLTIDPGQLLARLRDRRLQTAYVREYYLPFRMSRERMREMEEMLRPRPETPVNRDFAPIAYYFDLALWSTQFHPASRRWFQMLAGMGFGWVLAGVAALWLLPAVGLALLSRERRRQACAGLCMIAMGLTLIALEILLLLGFQAVYGYVYHQLAIVIAAFMVGMALGSWWALRRGAGTAEATPRELRALAGLQFLAALAPLLLCGLLRPLADVTNPLGLFLVSQLLFPLLALLCGLLGGYQFLLASRVFFGERQAARNPGTLYALDLAGSCLGAVALSLYLLPVFGFLRTAALIAVLNLFPAALAALAGQEKATWA